MYKDIGGYFELELPKGKEYHPDGIALNTGRNSLEYILRTRKYNKVYIPYYTCEVVLEPFKKLGIDFDFYRIDENLKPIIDFELRKGEAVLVNNYFGVTGHIVKKIASKYQNVIIDNSQAFFEKPIVGVDTFYSARKFFGVSDGAYLYTDKPLSEKFEQDVSYARFEHLLGRIDLGAEKFYASFKQNDEALKNQPIKEMSKLTKRILKSINYEDVIRKRKENFLYLHKLLSSLNLLNLTLEDNLVPMIYPLLIKNGKEMKKKLTEHKIFVATYWPNVKDWVENDNFENTLVNHLIALPIDQRYGKSEMKIINSIYSEV